MASHANRTKPPKGLLKNVLSEQQLCDLLIESNFRISSTETIRNTAQPYNIPIEYIKAVKNRVNAVSTGNATFGGALAHSL